MATVTSTQTLTPAQRPTWLKGLKADALTTEAFEKNISDQCALRQKSASALSEEKILTQLLVDSSSLTNDPAQAQIIADVFSQRLKLPIKLTAKQAESLHKSWVGAFFYANLTATYIPDGNSGIKVFHFREAMQKKQIDSNTTLWDKFLNATVEMNADKPKFEQCLPIFQLLSADDIGEIIKKIGKKIPELMPDFAELLQAQSVSIEDICKKLFAEAPADPQTALKMKIETLQKLCKKPVNATTGPMVLAEMIKILNDPDLEPSSHANALLHLFILLPNANFKTDDIIPALKKGLPLNALTAMVTYIQSHTDEFKPHELEKIHRFFGLVFSPNTSKKADPYDCLRDVLISTIRGDLRVFLEDDKKTFRYTLTKDYQLIQDIDCLQQTDGTPPKILINDPKTKKPIPETDTDRQADVLSKEIKKIQLTPSIKLFQDEFNRIDHNLKTGYYRSSVAKRKEVIKTSLGKLLEKLNALNLLTHDGQVPVGSINDVKKILWEISHQDEFKPALVCENDLKTKKIKESEAMQKDSELSLANLEQDLLLTPKPLADALSILSMRKTKFEKKLAELTKTANPQTPSAEMMQLRTAIQSIRQLEELVPAVKSAVDYLRPFQGSGDVWQAAEGFIANSEQENAAQELLTSIKIPELQEQSDVSIPAEQRLDYDFSKKAAILTGAAFTRTDIQFIIRDVLNTPLETDHNRIINAMPTPQLASIIAIAHENAYVRDTLLQAALLEPGEWSPQRFIFITVLVQSISSTHPTSIPKTSFESLKRRIADPKSDFKKLDQAIQDALNAFLIAADDYKASQSQKEGNDLIRMAKESDIPFLTTRKSTDPVEQELLADLKTAVQALEEAQKHPGDVAEIEKAKVQLKCLMGHSEEENSAVKWNECDDYIKKNYELPNPDPQLTVSSLYEDVDPATIQAELTDAKRQFDAILGTLQTHPHKLVSAASTFHKIIKSLPALETILMKLQRPNPDSAEKRNIQKLLAELDIANLKKRIAKLPEKINTGHAGVDASGVSGELAEALKSADAIQRPSTRLMVKRALQEAKLIADLDALDDEDVNSRPYQAAKQGIETFFKDQPVFATARTKEFITHYVVPKIKKFATQNDKTKWVALMAIVLEQAKKFTGLGQPIHSPIRISIPKTLWAEARTLQTKYQRNLTGRIPAEDATRRPARPGGRLPPAVATDDRDPILIID